MWITESDYLHGIFGKSIESKKIAGFDLDHTIIKPIDNKTFSKNDEDWEFFNNDVPKKLLKYHMEGYKIVIYTNQKGILKKNPCIDIWKSKIEKMANILQIPFTIIASIMDDYTRKPRTFMFDKLIKYDKETSFYCGDAGGLKERTINGSIFKDFSDGDLKFAINLGIKFIHRDEFIFQLQYKPSDYIVVNITKNIPTSIPIKFDSKKKEVIE